MQYAIRATPPTSADWSRVAQAHTLACDALRASYEALQRIVVEQIVRVLEGRTHEPQ
jgi:hypothetical protein